MSSETKPNILIIDDEQSMRELLSLVLSREGYKVDAAADGATALDLAKETDYDLALQDMKMPGLCGTELLAALKKIDPNLLVVIMTAFSSWDTAVEAMRLGAYDYIKKPFDNNLIKATVAKALEQKRLHKAYLEQGGKTSQQIPVNLIGTSTVIKEIAARIRQIAKTDSTVLITGESGSGKELVARSLHSSSLRSHQPFIAINCGAFSETLLESEMFGHVKGAFTGAVADKKGLFEVADKGTIFLDEIGETSPQLQVKLLRVLEAHEFMPVGSTTVKPVDVRVIAATNRNLEEEINSGRFREDLFYRLNVIPVHIPPLRSRREDIPLLAGHFLANHARRIGAKARRFTNAVLETLVAYDWPGNIRELDNIVHRAVALSHGETIDSIEISAPASPLAVPGVAPADIPDGFQLESFVEAVEKQYILKALEHCDNNMTNAAKMLGMTFRSIRYKVKKYGIKV